MRILLKNPVMKGLLVFAAAAAVLGLWFLARNGDDALADAKTDIVIQRDSFLAQVDAIHADPDSYVGKSITIQGLCGVVRMGEISYHLVYRVDPGCCGDDGPMHGFSFIGGGDAVRSGRWITVTGTLVEDPDCRFGPLTISAESVLPAPQGDRVAQFPAGTAFGGK